MKVEVDRSMCVGHAQCSAICPAVFANDELGYAVVVGDGTVAPEDEEGVELAVDSCPEQAIRVTDSTSAQPVPMLTAPAAATASRRSWS